MLVFYSKEIDMLKLDKRSKYLTIGAVSLILLGILLTVFQVHPLENSGPWIIFAGVLNLIIAVLPVILARPRSLGGEKAENK